MDARHKAGHDDQECGEVGCEADRHGSIYVGSNREFLDHLDRVAEALSAGGLYLLDSVVWFEVWSDYRRRWARRRGGVTARMTYRAEPIDLVAQTYNECVTLEDDDHGAKHRIESR